mmetsp:Transcript_61371/g.142845  ORF Transcript_61371/g.142845 Transcript_61371/m.142845 type:complete len:146 (+) Transcript_61371:91-528(+)
MMSVLLSLCAFGALGLDWDAGLLQTETVVHWPRVNPVSHFVPKGGAVCLQGPSDYMSKVLERLRKSPVQTGYRSTTLVNGRCSWLGYTQSIPKDCFPNATLWADKNKQHQKLLSSLHTRFVEEWKSEFGTTNIDAHNGMMKLCSM